MKRSLVLYGVSGLLALAGCGRMNGGGGYNGPFAHSTPTNETVALAIPESTARAAAGEDGVRTSALLGEEADSYTLTRGVTAVVNGGTAWVLGLVKLIVSYPPTSTSGADTAIWAPSPEPLAKKAWRLTVTRTAKHVFTWSFDAKAKADPDSAFITIISGTHTRAVDANDRPIENYGSGNFTLNWDAASTLPREPQDGHDVGVATFSYARLDPASVTSVAVDFNGVRNDDTGEIHNAIYRYTATPGAGGDFKYGSKEDAYPGNGTTGTAKETLTIHSRWQESGAGRSDYQVKDGDLAATVATVTECWDPSFASVFMSTSYDATKAWGAESSCAFAAAEYSSEAP